MLGARDTHRIRKPRIVCILSDEKHVHEGRGSAFGWSQLRKNEQRGALQDLRPAAAPWRAALPFHAARGGRATWPSLKYRFRTPACAATLSMRGAAYRAGRVI